MAKQVKIAVNKENYDKVKEFINGYRKKYSPIHVTMHEDYDIIKFTCIGMAFKQCLHDLELLKQVDVVLEFEA